MPNMTDITLNIQTIEEYTYNTLIIINKLIYFIISNKIIYFIIMNKLI